MRYGPNAARKRHNDRGDPSSNMALTELHRKAGKPAAAQFLQNLIKAVPYRIHTVLTDNGIQFTSSRIELRIAMISGTFSDAQARKTISSIG